MGFAVGIWEFLIISGTVVGVGGGVAYSEITRKRSKVDESQIADPVLKQKEKNLLEINKKTEKQEEEVEKDIENSHQESITTTELVLRGPRGFTFKPNKDEKNPDPALSITIDFVLEPDKENWKEAEMQEFKLPKSGTSIVKRWIRKNVTDGSENNKVECRYTWDEKPTEDTNQNKVATNLYNELKKLIETAKKKCTNNGGKGLTDTSAEKKELQTK